MKQTLCLVLCVLFLILSTSSSAIRRGKENPELNPVVSATSVEEDSFNESLKMLDQCAARSFRLWMRNVGQKYFSSIRSSLFLKVKSECSRINGAAPTHK
ncbi:PREDICTED: putative phytosulfokines 6 isoform X1 [Camelina sativa]|uniref:Phytosulfokines 6 isoform X1 n=1 Tax=Camelina sativa TaxID=90675 RepID=A0ABM1RTA8_CAMSA|nr:PREDICTED: putative phytosulfokines 6 isoform X1 [Camelina sativa]